MTTTGHDTLGTRSTLDVGGKKYAYYSLDKAAAKLGDVSRLPFSMKVLLENLLRFEDGGFTVSTDDVQALIDWQSDPRSAGEIQYRPARVQAGRASGRERGGRSVWSRAAAGP